MDKLYVGLGILPITLGVFVACFAGVGLGHNMTALNIISHIISYLIAISFIGVGGFLVITGVKS